MAEPKPRSSKRRTGRQPKATIQGKAPRRPTIDQLVGSIGPKVQELRRQRGLSLQQLAALAELSAASIHKIERGEMVPTITTLLKLASAFGRPVAYFIDEQPPDAAGVHLTPADERPSFPVTAKGSQRAGLTAATPWFRLAGDVIHIAPGASGEETPSARPGEQLLFVLDGTLEVVVGEREFTIAKGDTLHYLTDRTLRWGNTTRRPVNILRVAAAHN